MTMKLPQFVKLALTAAVVAGLALGGYLTRETWVPWFRQGMPVEPEESAAASGETATPTAKVIVSDQAQKNLGLTARPLKAQTFWKTIQVPGMVVDRPGVSDRGVVAPAAGVVDTIVRLPAANQYVTAMCSSR